jgi:SAM-dependent methyltransferase
MSSLSADPWKQHARQWAHVRLPLRPSAQDVGFTHREIAKWLLTTRQSSPTILLLGVTPELCKLQLPSGSRVIAVDKSVDMIQSIWPGRLRPGDEVICADWRRLPLASSSIDVVLADGSLSALAYPLEYAALFSDLRRLLRPRGMCIIRCYAQPDIRETPDEVFADLSLGQIGNFHVLKWRLAMALQSDAETGVAVESVSRTLREAWEDLGLLAERFAWPIAEILTIEAYRHVDTRYCFPTLDQYREFFSTAGFAVTQLATPSYELGKRCPTFVVEPRHRRPS